MRLGQLQPRELELLTQGHLMLEENRDLLKLNPLFISQFFSTSPFCSVGEQNQHFQICPSSLSSLLPLLPSPLFQLFPSSCLCHSLSSLSSLLLLPQHWELNLVLHCC